MLPTWDRADLAALRAAARPSRLRPSVRRSFVPWSPLYRPHSAVRAHFLKLWPELCGQVITSPPAPVVRLSAIEKSKRLAAFTAVDKHIGPEHKVRLRLRAAVARPHNRASSTSASALVRTVWRSRRGALTRTRRCRLDCALCRRTYRCPGSGMEQRARLHSYRCATTISVSRSARLMHYVGFQSKELIVRAGLRLGDVDQYPTLDVTIDGADECAPHRPPLARAR
jgi:hypothetical protein